MARPAHTYRANRRRSESSYEEWRTSRKVLPRRPTGRYAPSPIRYPVNGDRELARHARQIAAGSLKAENGLRSCF